MDVVDAVAPHGLYALHGSSPDVGVAGYSLGGGMGWAARRHGLQTNSLTAVELVTADGELVRADAGHHPDLFWALRGGGGNFGVVTALEFRLYPYTHAYAGWLVWDWAHAERVLRGWLDWTRSAPEDVTTSFRILQVPDIEAAPPPLRGRNIVAIDGAVLGGSEDAAELIAGLRSLGPELDTWATVPAPALSRLHGDPEEPTPAVSATGMLRGLDDAAVAAFVSAAGPDSGSPLMMAELRQLGGAVSRPAENAGALSHLDGDFVLFGGALALTPEMAAGGQAAADALAAAMGPWSTGRVYGNFAEEPTDMERAFADHHAYARLRALREQYDPHGVMHANHRIH
jgi:FAD/FMN-containing dehydrogenase